MKNIIKKTLGALLVASIFGVGLSACGLSQNSSSSSSIISSSTTNNELSEQEKIYELAVNSGYTGTYEEWLNSIKGKSVELSVQEGVICWRHQGDTDWKILISVSSLKGEDGLNGKEIELNVSPTHIQWRYVGESTYKDLISLDLLKGKDGSNGSDGTDGVDGLSAYEIAVKLGFEGDELAWLESLRGKDGTNGTDGREVEFNVTPTHIQWRYVGESTYKDLISLELLKGKDGSNGSNGTDGEDGKNGLSAYEIAVKLGFEGDELAWLESLRGQDGNNGLSAYEIYLKYHPEYTGSEEEWINSLVSGGLSSPRETYTVTFDLDNGSNNLEVKVLDGKKVDEPTVPEKEGYIFDGWYYGDLEWVFKGYSVTEDMTLSAKWIPIYYNFEIAARGSSYSFQFKPDEVVNLDNLIGLEAIESWRCGDFIIPNDSFTASEIDKKYAYSITKDSYWFYLEPVYQTFTVSFEDENLPDMEVSAYDFFILPNPTVPEKFKGWYCLETESYFEDGIFDIFQNITLVPHYYENLCVVRNYSTASAEQKTEILGILEKYAVDNFLTGIPFMDDGSYSLFRPEVKRGVTNYITGYGWGTLSDGNITADLATEPNPAWKRYYHSFLTEDPGQINYGDDKGLVVGDLIGYMASGYWGTRINETKDGYEWYANLAKEKPQPVNEIGSTGLATTFSWKLKTGADGLKYNTLTHDVYLAKYAGRGVAAEDYLTPFKLIYTRAHNWTKYNDNLDLIQGLQEYYETSSNGFSEYAWSKSNVGIKVETINGEAVMTVEFTKPISRFEAMNYMSNPMYAPVPMEFIKELGDGDFATGAALYQKTNLAKGYTPVDTSLSCGPYVLEAWKADKTIVFKKNELFNFNLDGRYQIPGVHYNILEAANTDHEAGLKEFLAGNIHSCDIPSTRLYEFKNLNDERGYAVYNPGGSNYKLNVNACDQETWEYLFGVNGTVTRTTEEDYWKCEPALSNRNFLKGLSYSINRKEFGESKGVGPSIDFLGDIYLSDPENGVSYNDTDAHKNAIAELTATNEYGYDVETAKAYFRKALEELVAEGAYKSGDVISIELAWQTQSQFTTYGDPIITYFYEAFNPVGAEFGIKLECTNWASAVWSDVYYDKMMVGQYDIGFGSVSGDPNNPLLFFEFLKSDNSSGYTLNWSCDTSEVCLEYDGLLWSFDSLWQAATQGGYFVDGKHVFLHDAEVVEDSLKQDADGKVTLVVDANILEVEGLEATVTKVVLNGYNKATQYVKFECEFVKTDDGNYLVTLDEEGYELFTTNNYYEADGNEVMIDVYYDCTVLEVPSEQYDTVYVLLDDIIIPAE